MAIKKVNTLSEYNAQAPSVGESDVTLISQERAVKYDGVNVRTDMPQIGDAVYHDGNEVLFIKGNTLKNSLLDSLLLTKVGFVCGLFGDYALICDKNSASKKYLDVCQYSITAINSTSLVIKLRMSPNYDVDTTVNVTLTSAAINATSADEISAAVAAKATEVGDTKAWWAYLANDNDEKVTSGGTKIIIQCDTCVDYRFTNVSATGCTIAHTTWGDLPAKSNYLKVNGKTTSYRGLMNIARGAAYWATNSTRVLSANVAVHGEASDTDPMKKSDFLTSAYAAELKAYYGTYEKYLAGEFGILAPQQQGAFSLLSGKEMTMKYALKTAPTKAGSTKYKFPHLYYCYNRSYGVDGLNFGDWFSPGVAEGVQMMDDKTIALVNPTATKMGISTISNSTGRWFAQRYDAKYAWNFSGGYGYLYDNNVCYALLSQAVALYKIKH
ncbi:MAG: hypothetical protein J5732_03100 [Bacteroidaceae bacterium]|nr:hypothetical protein [Bacteroidaceae bacterium]